MSNYVSTIFVCLSLSLSTQKNKVYVSTLLICLSVCLFVHSQNPIWHIGVEGATKNLIFSKVIKTFDNVSLKFWSKKFETKCRKFIALQYYNISFCWKLTAVQENNSFNSNSFILKLQPISKLSGYKSISITTVPTTVTNRLSKKKIRIQK